MKNYSFSAVVALLLDFAKAQPLGRRVGLTERAVDHLCERGRQSLCEALGRASRYLSQR